MASAAHIYKHRIERHVSPVRLGVILGNVALWAALIAGLAIFAGR
jgi:hypothetical protein